jgi:hypothetical protein
MWVAGRGAANGAGRPVYWQVGNRIRTEMLKSERAAYGEQIVVTLSRQLAAEFGHGFAEKKLRRMIRLEPFSGDFAAQGSVAPRILRGDLPDRAVERAYVASGMTARLTARS